MEPYSIPSQTFYNSNSSDQRQYEAHDDISIEVIGGEDISGNENDVQNVGDEAEFGDSNVLDESDIGIETGDIQNEERSESRVSEVSLGSVTLTEYLNKDKNAPDSDYDMSILSDSDVSEYIPTEREEKMAEKELKMDLPDNKKKSNPKNKSKKSKKRKNKFNDSFTVELLSPERIKSPVPHSAPKGEKFSSLSPVEFQSPKRMNSPDSQSTPKRGKFSIMPTSHSSGTFESPNSHGSRKDPKSIDSEGQMESSALLLENVQTFIYEKMTKDIIFKSYSPANLNAIYQLPELDKICIQGHTNTKEKRKFDKEHICYYCGSCVIKMSRHLLDQHDDIEEVKTILKMDRYSQERKNALSILTLKGDFLHNCHVIKEQKGILLVLRRPDAINQCASDPDLYIPCIYCLGFIQRTQAYKHVKSCCQLQINPDNSTDEVKSNRIVKHSKSLLQKMANPNNEYNDNEAWNTLKTKFRNDPTSRYILNDPTLCSYGRNECLRLGSIQEKHIRDRLRTVGTFCLEYHQQHGISDYYVKDILKTCNFPNIFKVAQMAFGKSLTPATRLGHYFKELIFILKNNAIFDQDSSMKSQLDDLFFLIDKDWNLITAPNKRKLKEQKPTVVDMPVTNDIKIFLNYLTCEITQNIEELKLSKTPNNFSSLNKLVLAYLIVFNRRREGEVSKVKLATYTNKPNYNDLETDTIQETLSPIEKHLSKTYSYMSTIGKRNRRVPILYPDLIVKALNTLVQNRHNCGILSSNTYLFPNSAGNFIRGSDCLRELVEQCQLKHTLKKPLLIKSTLLRKHVSTIAQILVLGDDEKSHLSNHLGHSDEVHREFYRQQESTIEKTQITKILGLINTGSVVRFKGKCLDDVTLDDVINAATNDVTNEPIDDDDDDDDDDHDHCNDSDLNIIHENKTPIKESVTSFVAFSEPHQKISVPSTSTSNPSNSKVTRLHWPKEVKDAIRTELSDCLDNIKNLTHERAQNFLAQHNMEERGYLKLKHVIYNMTRTPRPN